MFSLSIVIPCINEAPNLKILLPRLFPYKEHCSFFEILVVDGHSRDDTIQIAQALGAKAFCQEGTGYGNALKEAFRVARGEWILTLDADLSHHPGFIAELLSYSSSADMIIASRYIPKGFSSVQWIRRILSRILNWMYRMILNIPFYDLSSGFRLYRRSLLEDLNLTSQHYDILQELVIKSFVKGYRIIEVPFHFQARRKGFSKVRFLAFAWCYMKSLVNLWGVRNSIHCADYEEKAFNSRIPLQLSWVRKRYELLISEVKDETKLLCIGSGSNPIVHALPQAVYLDTHFNKLRYNRSPVKKMIQGNSFHLPFQNCSFEALILCNVLEHVSRDPEIFRECKRVLKPNGKIVISTPDQGSRLWQMIQWFYLRLNPFTHDNNYASLYTRAELLDLLFAHQFEITHTRYIFKSEMVITATVR
jgi:dolichol-phosphate mannosyltransferase